MDVKSVKERYIDVFKEFFDKLYGVDLDYSNTKEFKNYLESIENASKRFGEDFDVMITIKHRFGDFKLKGIDAYTRAKSMLEVVERGITLPDDVNSFEIIARIAVTKNGERKFLGKKDEIVFSHRILLSDEVEDKKAVEKIVGQKVEKMDKKIRAFTKEDMSSFSKIIRFKPTQKDLTI